MWNPCCHFYSVLSIIVQQLHLMRQMNSFWFFVKKYNLSIFKWVWPFFSLSIRFMTGTECAQLLSFKTYQTTLSQSRFAALHCKLYRYTVQRINNEISIELLAEDYIIYKYMSIIGVLRLKYFIFPAFVYFYNCV